MATPNQPAFVIPNTHLNLLHPDTFAGMPRPVSNGQNYALNAEILFSKSLNDSLWDYRDNYSSIYMLLKEIKDVAVESVATDQGILQLSNIFFSNAVLREFLMLTQMRFNCLQMDFNSPWNDLIRTIAMSLVQAPLVSTNTKDENKIPQDIAARRYSLERTVDTLISNTWLTTMLLIKIWGRVESYDELRAKYKDSIKDNIFSK